MSNGKLGGLVVVLALVLSIIGGFNLNATDKTTCATSFDYVTDVAGAFTGTGSDIEVDYDPASNITGYTVYDPMSSDTTTNSVHGINYSKTNANGYWIQGNSGNTTEKRLTFTNDKSTTAAASGRALMYWEGAGTPKTLTLDKDWGIDNAEARTIIDINGVRTSRVVGVPIADIIGTYGTLTTNNTYLVSVNPTNEFPGFIANPGFEYKRVTDSLGTYNAAQVTYSDISSQIKLNPLTGTVTLNGKDYSWTSVYYVWGGHSTTLGWIDFYIGSTAYTEYIDPVYGVQPTAVHLTNTTIVSHEVAADHVGGTISVPTPNEAGTFRVTGSRGNVAVYQDGGFKELFSYRIYNTPGQATGIEVNGAYMGSISSNWGSIHWDWSTNNHTIVNLWFNKTSWTDSNRDAVISISGISEAPKTQIMTLVTDADNFTSDFTVCDLINYTAGTTQQTTGPGNKVYSTSTTVTETVEQDVTYDTTYWINGENNTKLSMILKAPTVDTNNDIKPHFVLTDGSWYEPTTNIKCTAGAWTVDGVPIGNWPAIIITYTVINSMITVEVQPINNFVSFQDYTTIGTSTVLSTKYENIGNAYYLTFITFPDTDTTYPYHEIVKTKVLLVGGGLYVQDGQFNLLKSFPTNDLAGLKVMSAAHIGDYATIALSNGNMYSWLTNGVDGWIIDGKQYRFSDVTLYYVSEDLSPVIIGSVTYDGGIYLNGAEYEKGHLYAQYGKNSPLTDLGATTNNWSITLNGTWAVSTAYYSGSNTAAEITELDDFGTWGWSSTEFLIMFLGITVIGSIIAAWKYGYGWFDWIIVAVAGALIWIMLG